MDTRQLEMFVTLAEVLHFGRAAQQLGCTQPALSRAVQKLETDLDVQLFERDSRNVRLTDAGLAFLPGAVDVVEKAREASRVARTAGGAYYGRLVIGIGLCGQHPAVGQLVRRFRDRNPSIGVSVLSIDEPAIARALADGTMHALVAVDWAFPAGSHVRSLFTTDLVVVLPHDSPLSSKETIYPQDLDGVGLVLPNRRQQPMIAEHFRDFCVQEGVRPTVDIEAQTVDQVLGLVAGGAAAGLLPIPVELRYPGLVTRPFRPRYPINYCVGWRRSSPLTDRLVIALEAHCDGE